MASNPLNFGLTGKRVGRIRRVRAEATGDLPDNVLQTRLEKGHTKEQAYAQYPHGAALEAHAHRAEIRKRVSEAMFKEDRKNLPADEREAVEERQINRYYRYQVGDPSLRAHVEAPHGIEPSAEVKQWCVEHSVVDHEPGTAFIATQGVNHMVFKRSRLDVDVNSLPTGVKTSLRSEGAAYTKEDNMNAVKAQRDLTARVLTQMGNLNESGKVINPHLAVYFHGKTDKRGHDFEIAARQREGKGPLDPRVAFWFADKLEGKLQEKKEIKNLKGEPLSVNVVTYAGAYCGSPALTRLRYGDGVLDFNGFGEMLQCLQLECSRHLRDNNAEEIAIILNEIMAEFSDEFKTPEDLEKLDSYAGKFEEKMALEKANLFNTEKLEFDNSISEAVIGLNLGLREELGVENGDEVTVNGKTLKVIGMKKEHLKIGKTMMLHPSHKDRIGTAIVIEKAAT